MLGFWHSGVLDSCRKGLLAEEAVVFDDGRLALGATQLAVFDDCVVALEGELRCRQSGADDLLATIAEGYRRDGVACGADFAGLYLLALFDRREQAVHLLSDRAGLHPLYYRGDGDFGDCLPGLSAVGRSVPDDAALKAYLEDGALPAGRTGFAGILTQTPASRLVVRAGGVERVTLEDRPKLSFASEADLHCAVLRWLDRVSCDVKADTTILLEDNPVSKALAGMMSIYAPGRVHALLGCAEGLDGAVRRFGLVADQGVVADFSPEAIARQVAVGGSPELGFGAEAGCLAALENPPESLVVGLEPWNASGQRRSLSGLRQRVRDLKAYGSGVQIPLLGDDFLALGAEEDVAVAFCAAVSSLLGRRDSGLRPDDGDARSARESRRLATECWLGHYGGTGRGQAR